MNKLKNNMDRYSITARVYPMIIFYLPLSVLFIVTIWDFQQYYQYGVPAIIVAVLSYFTSHVGRDAGKSKESELWREWNGTPTTQLFRWSDNTIDVYTKQRNHAKMNQLCPVNNIINAQFELANPNEADEVYKAWTKFAISKTRDTSQYPLICKENIGYGFRRNLWGLKPYAMLLIVTLMISIYGFFVYKTHLWNVASFPKVFIISELYLLFFLSIWLIKITKSWVKLNAFAYAERLHESIETF